MSGTLDQARKRSSTLSAVKVGQSKIEDKQDRSIARWPARNASAASFASLNHEPFEFEASPQEFA